MKKYFFTFLFLVIATYSFNPVMAATVTFSSAPSSTLITEQSGLFSGSISYTPTWDPGSVTSAKLSLVLSDDVSSTLSGFSAIDIPKEFARISNIRDGFTSLGTQSTAEVEQTGSLFDPTHIFPFDTPFPGNDGFENPLTGPVTTVSILNALNGIGVITPSLANYFDIDVVSLIDTPTASGLLNFDLIAVNAFNPVNLPQAFLAAVAPFGFDPLSPQTIIEDFIFDHAELVVTFDSASVSTPSIILLMLAGLLGMLSIRKPTVKVAGLRRNLLFISLSQNRTLTS